MKINEIPLSTNLQINKSYYLLLVDIKKSTRHSPKIRQKIFEKLEVTIKEINQKPQHRPAFKLTISYGDEIAGLFDTPIRLYDIVSELREALYPDAHFRCVVASGKIGVAADDIRKVGGQVFKDADEYIERLKKQDRFCYWALEDSHQSAILNSLTEMSNNILERMSPYQRQNWQLLESGLSQKEISERLDKYPQSVSNALKQGGADLVLNSGVIINEILSRL